MKTKTANSQYKVDSYRVSQYENQRIVDTVTLLENPKKCAKKAIVYSPMLRANVRVYLSDLK
jgi:hypothetical protein